MSHINYKILIPERQSGGVESYSLELYHQMMVEKKHVELLYLDDYSAGKTIFHYIINLRKILQYIPKNDIVISHGQFGLIALFRENILVIHGNPLDYFSKASSWARKLRLRSILLASCDYFSDLISIYFSHKVIFVSEHVKESFNFFLPSNKTIFVNYSIKYSFMEYIKPSVKYFAVISNAAYEKGLDRLQTFVNSYRLKCDVAGISDGKISSNLNYLGRLSGAEIHELNKVGSVLIHLSRYEGLPLAVLEALSMSCKCIVIKSEWSNIFSGLRSVLILEEDALTYSKEVANLISTLNSNDLSVLKEDYLRLDQKIKAINDAI
jgi:hypothetical protein